MPEKGNQADEYLGGGQPGREGKPPHLPLVLAALKAEWPALVVLPYQSRRIDLTAAGSDEITFSGNYICVMRLAGTAPELRIRVGEREGADVIYVTSECTLTMAYDKLRLEWGAIVGGAVDILLGTALP